MKLYILSLSISFCLIAPLAAQEEDPEPHKTHQHHHDHSDASSAPIGVMGDHVHGQGDFMFSYRYMSMDMDGNRDGTRDADKADVFAEGFMVAPLSMTMEMHMVGGMYGISDDVTIMAMIPHLSIEMEHITMMGMEFTTEAEGIGDVKVSALWRVFEEAEHQVHFNIGVSAPTGSIDEKDDTPMGADSQLPYPMQLGSGTWDVLPGVTYLGHSGDWSWGGQLFGTLRLGENDRDYTLGNKVNLTIWGQRAWAEWISTSLRLDVGHWEDIDGQDADLMAGMVPTADPDRRGGTRIDALLGIGVTPLQGHRIAVEVGIPIYQNLEGPQLETDLTLTLGWQYAF